MGGEGLVRRVLQTLTPALPTTGWSLLLQTPPGFRPPPRHAQPPAERSLRHEGVTTIRILALYYVGLWLLPPSLKKAYTLMNFHKVNRFALHCAKVWAQHSRVPAPSLVPALHPQGAHTWPYMTTYRPASHFSRVAGFPFPL